MERFEAAMNRVIEDNYCEDRYFRHSKKYPIRFQEGDTDRFGNVSMGMSSNKSRSEFRAIHKEHAKLRKKDLEYIGDVFRNEIILGWWD